MERIYCYVDETGQDVGSDVFIVVAIVSIGDQEVLRSELIKIEQLARTHSLKWHKTSGKQRLQYLSLVLQQHIAFGDVYFGRYQKPLPYFFPMLEVIEKAIKQTRLKEYKALIIVDGIDAYKTPQLTNALRISGIRLGMVQSRRDESEPLIRLADMWAGCIRAAFRADKKTQTLFQKALHSHAIIEVTKKNNPP